MASEPVAELAAVGANLTWSVIACLELKVTGNVAPDIVKLVPLIVAEFTVTEPVPVEVSVTPSVALEPTVTSPKLRLVGLTVNSDVVVPVPVPLRLTATVGFVDALLFTVNVPVTAPAAVGAYFTLSASVCFGFSVTGNVAPDTVNPLPVIAAELTVTADVPDEVIVTESVLFEPTATLPKLSEVGLIVHCGVPVPVPLKLTATVGFVDALLFTVNVPVTAPAAVGAYFTLSASVCFGFSVTGNVAPDTVNPLPVIAAELTVTADVPDEVIVTESVLFEPTATLPKLSEFGLIVHCGVPVPVPLKLTATVGFVDALLFTVNVPVTAPAAVGAYFTLSASVCFGFSVTGNVAPDTVNPLPVIAAELTVTADVPDEVIVTESVLFEPTATLPKLSEVGLIVHCGVPVPVPLKLTATVGFVDALLFTVNVPVTAPAAVGAYFTLSASVCFGFSVTGNVAPDTVNPLPVIAAELTVTADVPDE